MLNPPINYRGLDMGDYHSNYSTGNKGGNKVGKFFLGALVGAASAGLAVILLEGEPTYSGSSSTHHTSNAAPWIIGGAVVGGVLFVIDF